jgi:hypothetical protein
VFLFALEKFGILHGPPQDIDDISGEVAPAPSTFLIAARSSDVLSQAESW